MEKQLLSKYRAEVIERFINVEWIIHAIISQHYFRRVESPFLLEVLYDEYFTFALKRRVLEKIIKDVDVRKIQELNRLNTIRNYFAHCNQEFIEIQTQKSRVIDPRNINKEIDFKGLYSEFTEKVGEIEEYLGQLFINLGGEWVKQD